MSATRTKRILSIQPVAERGGSDRALLGLVRSLAEDGWDCHIAMPAPTPMAAEFLAAGATVHVVPMRRVTKRESAGYLLGYLAGWPLVAFRLARLARRLDTDVIHSNSIHSWYGWAVAAVLGKPHIWHAREIVVQSGAVLTFERWLCRHFATRVIAVSAAVAAQLHGRNVVVGYDAPDPDEFCPGRAGAFRAGAGIADDVPLVGGAGRIDDWKGFDVLLDAVPALLALRPDVQVVIAGGPVPGKEAFFGRLQTRAAAMPAVHWLGAREDMAALMADLDVFVLASTNPEPFGLVVVEALACGVPVVATATGGPVEILSQGGPGAGRLFACRDSAGLAEAAVALLPPGPSSTARRLARPVLWRRPEGPALPDLFNAAL